MNNNSNFPIFQYFQYSHLPEHLQKISKPFHDLASQMINIVQDGESIAEKEMGLRKLLEAKDCFVRAGLKPTDPLGYDLNIFYRILLANELGNDIDLALQFSDADGIRTGKSGYSFGVSQFDVANNSAARTCLEECGFFQDEIQDLISQVLSLDEMKKFNMRLYQAGKTVEQYDKMNISQTLIYVSHLLTTSGISLSGGETIYHIADYHNQFYLSRDGKLHNFLKTANPPITPNTILQFKLNETDWGKKRPDDVKRRYNNIVEIYKSNE